MNDDLLTGIGPANPIMEHKPVDIAAQYKEAVQALPQEEAEKHLKALEGAIKDALTRKDFYQGLNNTFNVLVKSGLIKGASGGLL